MNKKTIIILIIILIGLFIWGRFKQKENITVFDDTDIACLENGHQSLAEHIHPILKITVDGETEIIPANIGIKPDCMSELHTHDTTGTIHAESFLRGRIENFNLSHFFAVWGEGYQREGFSLEIKQDGVIKNSIEEVDFKDGSLIELIYTSNI